MFSVSSVFLRLLVKSPSRSPAGMGGHLSKSEEVSRCSWGVDFLPILFPGFMLRPYYDYLVLHNKSFRNLVAETNSNHFIICHGFCGSGLWAGLAYVILAWGLSHGGNRWKVKLEQSSEVAGAAGTGRASLPLWLYRIWASSWGLSAGLVVLPHCMVAQSSQTTCVVAEHSSTVSQHSR